MLQCISARNIIIALDWPLPLSLSASSENGVASKRKLRKRRVHLIKSTANIPGEERIVITQIRSDYQLELSKLLHWSKQNQMGIQWHLSIWIQDFKTHLLVTSRSCSDSPTLDWLSFKGLSLLANRVRMWVTRLSAFLVLSDLCPNDTSNMNTLWKGELLNKITKWNYKREVNKQQLLQEDANITSF